MMHKRPASHAGNAEIVAGVCACRTGPRGTEEDADDEATAPNSRAGARRHYRDGTVAGDGDGARVSVRTARLLSTKRTVSFMITKTNRRPMSASPTR